MRSTSGAGLGPGPPPRSSGPTPLRRTPRRSWRASTTAGTARPSRVFLKGELPSDELRLFVGHSGWGPGQLAGELERKAWDVVPADLFTLFRTEPQWMWETLTEGRTIALLRAPRPRRPTRRPANALPRRRRVARWAPARMAPEARRDDVVRRVVFGDVLGPPWLRRSLYSAREALEPAGGGLVAALSPAVVALAVGAAGAEDRPPSFESFVTARDGSSSTGNGSCGSSPSTFRPSTHVEDEVRLRADPSLPPARRLRDRDALESVRQMGGQVVRMYTIRVRRAQDPDEVPTYVLARGGSTRPPCRPWISSWPSPTRPGSG